MITPPIAVRVEVQDFCDCRNKAQLASERSILQKIADQQLEAEWRCRVRENVQARLSRRVDLMMSSNQMLRNQAS